eukprot:scaffold107630_cov59-Phaeocystis_antarctica.AAC.3
MRRRSQTGEWARVAAAHLLQVIVDRHHVPARPRPCIRSIHAPAERFSQCFALLLVRLRLIEAGEIGGEFYGAGATATGASRAQLHLRPRLAAAYDLPHVGGPARAERRSTRRPVSCRRGG